eukprot:TRINITY_DN5521_c0_g1_i2.p1 TRINITY_DN5521_c0_g1~~TRINITY_DN5521_c0_g1_i2.p1  ORF type:complete len:137 (-),score=0.17 TRINITY_DN5521_c0_g1_i2:115-525(-)
MEFLHYAGQHERPINSPDNAARDAGVVLDAHTLHDGASREADTILNHAARANGDIGTNQAPLANLGGLIHEHVPRNVLPRGQPLGPEGNRGFVSWGRGSGLRTRHGGRDFKGNAVDFWSDAFDFASPCQSQQMPIC